MAADKTNTAMGVLAMWLHTQADNTNDRHDHDELHAAAAIVGLSAGEPVNLEYVGRWITGLIAKAAER